MAPSLWGFLLAGAEDTRLESEDNVLQEFPKAIEHRAAIIQSTGKDPELVEKLIKAADTMRDSGNLYMTWAKHYASMAKGNTDASSDEDETEDFDV